MTKEQLIELVRFTAGEIVAPTELSVEDAESIVDDFVDKERVFKHKIMKRNISETPEKWVILKLPNNYYKVFGTWAGGYLDGDKWKLNSGIDKVEQDENFYYFIGFSGSCYKCHKKGYGTATSYGLGILNKIIEQGNGQIELMEDGGDWLNVI